MGKVGTRAQVWHGTAERTSGGLTKKDLVMKKGRIRSRRASQSAKRNNNLKKAGWTFKRGTFGAVRVGEEKKKRRGKSSKKRTGSKKRRSPSRKRRTGSKEKRRGSKRRTGSRRQRR
jgi:hypothetical protein